jgi:hypothetical protein
MSALIETAKKHWKILVPGTIAVLGIIAWLAFGYFGVQTLFFDDEVNETAPVFDSEAAASGLPSDEIDADLTVAINDAAAEVELTEPSEPAEESAVESTDQADVVTVREGDFIDRSHPSRGRAVVLNDGSEQRFLRFEDFETDNGPDLNVYLSTAPADAPTGEFDDDFIDLGDLKGNIGPQNYEIPTGVDLDRYNTVVIWCVRFGVAFGAADLG